MSRSILIQGTYFNGKTVQRGVYNKTNAEYKKSCITFNDMFECLQSFIKDLKGKRLKDLKIMHSISSGICDDYIQFVYTTPKLNRTEMIRQVEINNAAYTACLK